MNVLKRIKEKCDAAKKNIDEARNLKETRSPIVPYIPEVKLHKWAGYNTNSMGGIE